MLAVIIGSIRSGRVGPTVANWFAGQARQREDLMVNVIDLTEAPLPMVMPGGKSAPSSEAARVLEILTPQLAAADAFVVVTPEYSLPASLKNVIDWHPQQWEAKPVGFVSYGGRSGGLRTAEQLRLVFGELHTVPLRNTVSFHTQDQFDENGDPIHPDGCTSAAKLMLDQLTWWAQTLREGRTARRTPANPLTPNTISHTNPRR